MKTARGMPQCFATYGAEAQCAAPFQGTRLAPRTWFPALNQERK